MSDTKITYQKSGLYSIYWLFAVVYAFIKGSFWWGVLNIFLPIAPMIDLVKWLVA